MKKIKINELISLILVAVFFFIIGYKANQLNIEATVKNLITSSAVDQSPHTPLNTLQVETKYEIDDISQLSLKKVKIANSEKPLKFLVAGHIYGNPYEIDNSHPAMTIQTNLQLFNQMDLDMIVLLGDIVQESSEENFENFERNFLHYIENPVFNAVGNHDMEDRNLYIEKFGETNFSFFYKNHLLIFLDTNIEPFTLADNQLQYIKETIIRAKGERNLEAIHIFAHHVFFFKPSLSSFDSKYQTNVNYSMEKRVEKFMEDDLIPLSVSMPIYIFTGDVGAWCGNLTPYYDKFKGSNVTTIATGIGNCDEDSVLIVQEINGEIFIEPYSLVGREMLPIESYNNIYWSEN